MLLITNVENEENAYGANRSLASAAGCLFKMRKNLISQITNSFVRKYSVRENAPNENKLNTQHHHSISFLTIFS